MATKATYALGAGIAGALALAAFAGTAGAAESKSGNGKGNGYGRPPPGGRGKGEPPPPPPRRPPPGGPPPGTPPPGGGTPQTPPQVPPTTTPACTLDPGIPPNIRALAEQTIAGIQQNVVAASHAEMVAQQLDAAGFPMAAACVRQAAGLDTPPGGVVDTPPLAPPGGIAAVPYVIKQGDGGPWNFAKAKTGNGNRAMELGPLNPHLGPWPHDPQWHTGVQILVPADWFI